MRQIVSNDSPECKKLELQRGAKTQARPHQGEIRPSWYVQEWRRCFCNFQRSNHPFLKNQSSQSSIYRNLDESPMQEPNAQACFVKAKSAPHAMHRNQMEAPIWGPRLKPQWGSKGWACLHQWQFDKSWTLQDSKGSACKGQGPGPDEGQRPKARACLCQGPLYKSCNVQD